MTEGLEQTYCEIEVVNVVNEMRDMPRTAMYGLWAWCD